MFRWLQDQILAALQRRCTHPGEMVTADALEGCADGRPAIRHCRRCGALKPIWAGIGQAAPAEWDWRTPDPNLWRGR